MESTALGDPRGEHLFPDLSSNQHQLLAQLLLRLSFCPLLNLAKHLVPKIVENLNLGLSVHQLISKLLLDEADLEIVLPHCNPYILNDVILQ